MCNYFYVAGSILVNYTGCELHCRLRFQAKHVLLLYCINTLSQLLHEIYIMSAFDSLVVCI